MNGEFTAYYLTEREYKFVVEANKRFEATYKPYLVILTTHYHNENVFEGTINRGTTFDRETCFTRFNKGGNTIISDYYEKTPGYFTFDGIRFFQIMDIMEKSDDEGLLLFTFKYLNTYSFVKNTAFMVMPFRYPKLNEMYSENVKKYLKHCDLEIDVFRADDFTGTDVVADTILEQIRRAEFIICEITNCNKNVFFEIGYAKGIGKDIIFLLEKNKPAKFFDVNHIRRIEYGFDDLLGFQKLLHGTLVSVRNHRQ
jgi:hypothetical protein